MSDMNLVINMIVTGAYTALLFFSIGCVVAEAFKGRKKDGEDV